MEKKEREIVHTMDLRFPVQRGETETIKFLEFRRARGKDVKHLLSDRSENNLIRTAIKLTGQPSDVFDEMDARDFFDVMQYLGELLADGRETGSKDSD